LALNQNGERAEVLSFHCAAAHTGPRRAKLLCLGFIIHSWETHVTVKTSWGKVMLLPAEDKLIPVGPFP